MIMEQFWNYFGFVGIAIMMLTLVVMICEYADCDEAKSKMKHPALADDGFNFWIPAWFEYKHTWVQTLARSCFALSVVLMLIVAAGPLYDLTHQDLRAPFAYLVALGYATASVYLWMQAIRLVVFLLMMLLYFILWSIEWIFGTDFLTEN